MNDFLTDTGVVVVGAGSGLGAGTADALHARGANVILADVDIAAANSHATRLATRARAIECDVADSKAVAKAISAGTGFPRGLRAAVVCAGIGTIGGVLDDSCLPHDLELFERTLRVNLVGTFNVLRFAAQAMHSNEPDEDGGRGVIVLTGSLSGLEGAAGEVAYAASKGGVHAMTLPAARELATAGIRVVTVAPGSFDTAMMAGLSPELTAEYGASMPFPKRFGTSAEFGSLVEQIAINPMLNGTVMRLDAAVRHQ